MKVQMKRGNWINEGTVTVYSRIMVYRLHIVVPTWTLYTTKYTLNWEIFATNNTYLRFSRIDFTCKFFCCEYSYTHSKVLVWTMYGETHEIFSHKLFCLPDMAPICEIYFSQIFSDLGYNVYGCNKNYCRGWGNWMSEVWISKVSQHRYCML